jgi:NB-ARC domain
MIIDTSILPTHVAQVATRVNVVGPDSSADTFLAVSYLAEATIKTIAIVLQSGLAERSRDDAYRFAYSLVRADGLGTWERAVYESTTLPLAATLPPEFQSVVHWITRRRTREEDEWLRTARENTLTVLRELGVDEDVGTKAATVKGLVTALVQIRNKTKAHGAVGQDFFAAANEPYTAAVKSLVETCPAFRWHWMHLSVRKKGNTRGVKLSGSEPAYMRDADAGCYPIGVPGIYFVPDQGLKAYVCSQLLRSNLECTSFMLPNGGYNGHGKADFLNYGTGASSKEDVSQFITPPTQLPDSETHGLDTLDVQANIFGNLPELPIGYVTRQRLERELEDKLLDKNHPIITLHGRGGIGKTTLALCAAHKIAAEYSSHFEYIVWFSARDIDLRPAGPVSVRPAVLDLEAVAKQYGTMFGVPPTLESLAQVLQSPAAHSNKGILFIFDNFESMTWLTELHRFLDTYTHLPNKVLITSRERAFKADYPIEVTGMEFAEAAELMKLVSAELGIRSLVTNDVIKAIYKYTEGHAYVIRVIVGEIAKERRYVPPAQLMTKRMDIVSAVFERSFNKLSDSGRWLFLAVANWRSMISELALLVTLGQRGIDVDSGLDECRRLSLITRHELADGQPCYSAPQLARVFGIKKLEGDPDRLSIQEDLDTLTHFGVLALHEDRRETQEDLVRRFVSWCQSEAIGAGETKLKRLDTYLETVANLWPDGWLELFHFRQRFIKDPSAIEYAIRRAVEEMPFNKKAWLVRARHAETKGDTATCTASFVSAVETDPSDVALIREAAYQVGRYVNDHSGQIPIARRGTYLASLRSHMEKVADNLDATGLSRLAWLFLLEGERDRGEYYAKMGLKKDPQNGYCRKILEKKEAHVATSKTYKAVRRGRHD